MTDASLTDAFGRFRRSWLRAWAEVAPLPQPAPLPAPSRSRSPCWVALALVALVALVGCGGGDGSDGADAPEPTPDPRISTESPMEALGEADFGDLDPSEMAINTFWTRNRVTNSATPDETVRLVGVSTETLEGFDRVIFTFEGEDVPGYRFTLGTEDGGGCDGTEAGLDTPAHLAVELVGATASEGGRSLVADRDLSPGMPALARAVQTCDADGTVRWLLGMAADTEFRMMQMRGEPRLVADLRHPEG